MSSEQNVIFHPSKTEFSRNKKFDPDYFFGKTRLLAIFQYARITGRKFCALINLFVQRGTAVNPSIIAVRMRIYYMHDWLSAAARAALPGVLRCCKCYFKCR